MSKNYPYIQDEREIDGECSTCHVKERILSLEWRVDWFQGNCEFEKICHSCLKKRQIKEEREEEEYERKMKPIWEKKQKEEKIRADNCERLINEAGYEIQKFNNTGQWNIGGVIDWWTTTGTAIARKSRNRYTFYKENPDIILEALKKETT